jgi:hypothetical protein
MRRMESWFFLENISGKETTGNRKQRNGEKEPQIKMENNTLHMSPNIFIR